MRMILILAVLVLRATLGAGQQTPPPPTGSAAAIHQTRPFIRNGNLRIMLLEGSVRVGTWDRDSIRVAARLDAAGRRGFYFAASPEGAGKLGVDTDGAGAAELDVTVPPGTRLWVKTAGAPIEVSGVEGSLDLYAVTGGVRVRGSPRSVYAESMGGDIEVDGSPAVARLRTGAGSIRVHGAGPDLTLTTVTGGITVTAGAPLRRVAAETVSGLVRIDAALEPVSAVSVTSHDGAVELRVPPATDAEFRVVTLEGELRNELTRGGARKTAGLKGRELSFTSGSGDAQVTVRTFSGTVTIRPREP
jgi:hypothetical protein